MIVQVPSRTTRADSSEALCFGNAAPSVPSIRLVISTSPSSSETVLFNGGSFCSLLERPPMRASPTRWPMQGIVSHDFGGDGGSGVVRMTFYAVLVGDGVNEHVRLRWRLETEAPEGPDYAKQVRNEQRDGITVGP